MDGKAEGWASGKRANQIARPGSGCNYRHLFLYLCELQFRTTWFLQDHPITGNFQLINHGGVRRLDLNAILIAEFVLAADIARTNGAVI